MSASSQFQAPRVCFWRKGEHLYESQENYPEFGSYRHHGSL